ncbi:unnamed protein product, partial [Scytosiphon promiscuus]
MPGGLDCLLSYKVLLPPSPAPPHRYLGQGRCSPCHPLASPRVLRVYLAAGSLVVYSTKPPSDILGYSGFPTSFFAQAFIILVRVTSLSLNSHSCILLSSDSPWRRFFVSYCM